MGARAVKKVPLLRGKTVVNVFFENSTRTRTTFELAAKRLSADVITLNVSTSSTSKGETLSDTLRNLEAMAADMFVVRHADSGAAHFIAEHVCPDVAVINGGDGRHAHPTQGMLDMLTIRRHKGDFSQLSVAIVGDILHSRVGALEHAGAAHPRLPGHSRDRPRTLLPVGLEQYGVRVFTDMDAGLQDVDVVIMLRLQKERMQGGLLPSEGEFFRLYGLTEKRLARARPDAIVMHPGPINRGVEIDSAVADGPHSVILNQVTYGIAIRMAVLSMTMSGQTAQRQSAQRSRGAALMSISILGARLLDPASGIDPHRRPAHPGRSDPGHRRRPHGSAPSSGSKPPAWCSAPAWSISAWPSANPASAARAASPAKRAPPLPVASPACAARRTRARPWIPPRSPS